MLNSYDEKWRMEEPAMKPSEALTAHRAELRQLVSRYSVAHPRVPAAANQRVQVSRLHEGVKLIV